MVESLREARNPRSARGSARRLEAWSRAHALLVCLALLVCAASRTAWPLVCSAVPSLFWLLIMSSGAYTPSGRFGLANALTAFRLSLSLVLISMAPSALGRWGDVSLVTFALLCDGLDGWLARARGDASAFGAHFDMESDALLVLAVTVRLWLAHGLGAWALSAGLLRYAYVLWLWLGPLAGPEAPRSPLARYAFVLAMLGLMLGLASEASWARVSVGLGTLVMMTSFARSFYYSQRAA